MRSSLLLLVAAACSGGSSNTKDANGSNVPPGCGDGVKMGAEQCDKADLGGATCETATSPGWVGTVACSASCELNVAGCNPPTTTWSTFNDSSKWSLFDSTTLFPGAKGFASTVFDGRYMYFVPSNNGASDGIVLRYDTQGGFGSSGSWATFDVSTVNVLAKGFIGGAFDGRYVYLVPYNNGTTYDGVTARYDTQAAGGFGASASWTTFDIASVDANARGFVTASFDGRYLYYSPHYNGAYHAYTARYDTQADFATASSWTVFDMSTVNANAKGFLGTVFDGRYIYYLPYYNNVAYHGNVMRYDTQATDGFASASAWSSFDVATTNGNDVGFYGIAFDGRYMYLAQYYDGAAATPAYGGYVVRYDTQAAFTTASSWQTFNVQSLNGAAAGFVGATFDGRYVYLAPHYNGAYDGMTVRYDTQGAGFASSSAWTMFDMATLSGNAVGFHGAGFDGQYVYFSPSNSVTGGATPMNIQLGVVARFSAKSPSWLPLGWHAAFD